MDPVDLNLEALPCAVLCCIAIEAFANEVSSLSSAFFFDKERGHGVQNSTAARGEPAMRMGCDSCQDIAQIKNDPKGSFYERYKTLLKALGIETPTCLQSLSHLRDLRDAIVHFRSCDVPIVHDSAGVIRYAQEPPQVFAYLKSRDFHGWPVVSSDCSDDGTEWTLRASTNAMAAWSLSLVLEAIMHVLDRIPAGSYRDSILKAYASRDVSFDSVFEKANLDLEEWWKEGKSSG